MMFALALHEIAEKVAKEFTFDGDEGTREYRLTYVGHVSSNYPWLYVDFEVAGSMPLRHLVEVEARIRTACEECPNLASYLTTTLTRRLMRCRLLHRADLPQSVRQS